MTDDQKPAAKPKRSRTPGTYVTYRGVPLPATKISRSKRTRQLYEAMKAAEATRP